MADSIGIDGIEMIRLRKEAIYIKGTEKQIDFAKKLIDRFNNEMDRLINECPEEYKNDWIARKEKINMVLKESYAGDVIHILNINEKTGKDYYIAFYSRLLSNADVASMRIKEEVFGGNKE